MEPRERKEKLSEAAERFDALELYMLTRRANGELAKEEEESIIDALDRLWLDMSDAEQSRVDARNAVVDRAAPVESTEDIAIDQGDDSLPRAAGGDNAGA